MKNRIRTWIVIGIVFVVYTVLAFALPFEMNAVFWLSYVFGVVAIGAQIYLMHSAFETGDSPKSKFYGFPVANIGLTYLAVQLGLGLVMMIVGTFLPVPVWLPLVAYVVILAVAAIGFVAADAMRESVERQDVKLEADVTAMRALQSKIGGVVGLCGEELRQEAEKLAEAFRFSDPVSSDATKELEHELDMILGELQSAVVDGDSESAKALCRKASVTLMERNRLCKLSKR